MATSTPTQARLAATITAALVAHKRPTHPHYEIYELAELNDRDVVLTLTPEGQALFGLPGETYEALDAQDEGVLGGLLRRVADPFALLGSRQWATDTQYPAVFEHNPGVQWPTTYPGRPDLGHYLQEHKADRCLAALLLGTSRHCQAETIRFYGLPTNTLDFLKWANDWVSWQGARDRPQFELFPWAKLYEAWQRLQGPAAFQPLDAMVYLLPEGRILAQDQQHTLLSFDNRYLTTLPTPTDA